MGAVMQDVAVAVDRSFPYVDDECVRAITGRRPTRGWSAETAYPKPEMGRSPDDVRRHKRVGHDRHRRAGVTEIRGNAVTQQVPVWIRGLDLEIERRCRREGRRRQNVAHAQWSGRAVTVNI